LRPGASFRLGAVSLLLAAGLSRPQLSRAQAPHQAPRRILFGSCLDPSQPHPQRAEPALSRLEGAPLGEASLGAGYPGAYPGAYLLEDFGEPDVDWGDPHPVLRVRIFDVAGEVRLSLDIPLAELGFPR
jgi:hypothetical protein